jgi:predicted nucleotidyltransferase component of viral defense system
MENTMTFHQAQAFRDAVEAAAIYHQLQPIFIEKDYWVTYILKNIALSAYSKQVVFKGGTSLSKAYQCIERFSEDVDLALLKTGRVIQLLEVSGKISGSPTHR